MYKVLPALVEMGKTPGTSTKKPFAINMLGPTITSLLLAHSLAGSPGFSDALPASAFEPLQSILHGGEHDTIDIVTGSDFNGLTTFANLPYSNCFRERGETLDIAILGAPFDTVSILVFLTFTSI